MTEEIKVIDITPKQKTRKPVEWMKIGRFIVSIVCVLAAVYLAANKSDQWGWFLFVAALSSGVL